MNNGIYGVGMGNKATLVQPRLPLGMKQAIRSTGSARRGHQLNSRHYIGGLLARTVYTRY